MPALGAGCAAHPHVEALELSPEGMELGEPAVSLGQLVRDGVPETIALLDARGRWAIDQLADLTDRKP